MLMLNGFSSKKRSAEEFQTSDTVTLDQYDRWSRPLGQLRPRVRVVASDDPM
jgi:hypothetical protein